MNPSPAGYRLGLDLGSISLKCIVIDSSTRIVFERYVRTGGCPRSTALRVLNDIADEFGTATFSGAVVTGSGHYRDENGCCRLEDF